MPQEGVYQAQQRWTEVWLSRDTVSSTDKGSAVFPSMKLEITGRL